MTTMTGLTVAVDVPKGAAGGDVVTLPGFGIEGYGRGPPGDLNVPVDVAPDPTIEAGRDASAVSSPRRMRTHRPRQPARTGGRAA